MQHPDHPQPERLSALSSGDADALGDPTLAAHVRECAECTDTVDDLGRLRSALGDLPDLLPHRPLQLLPPVPETTASAGRSGWLRRLAAPVLAAGAGLVLVGSVGIGATLLGGMAASGGATFANVGENLEGAESDGRGAAASADSLQPQVSSAPAQPMASAEDTAQPPTNERLNERSDDPFAGWILLVGAGAIVLTVGVLLRYVVNPGAG